MTDRTGNRLYDRERDAAELPGNRNRDRVQALKALTAGRSVVYAVRLADGVIKIGCSSSLWNRRRSWGAKAEILGFMFGDMADEQAIHSQLVDHRTYGFEYYRPMPAVLAVVNDMRDVFGLPNITA